jgi:hypothetical protein
MAITQVDMWSAGVVLYILLAGYPPFYSESEPALFDQIRRGAFSFDDPVWDSISPGCAPLAPALQLATPPLLGVGAPVREGTFKGGEGPFSPRACAREGCVSAGPLPPRLYRPTSPAPPPRVCPQSQGAHPQPAGRRPPPPPERRAVPGARLGARCRRGPVAAAAGGRARPAQAGLRGKPRRRGLRGSDRGGQRGRLRHGHGRRQRGGGGGSA